ncbi:MAG: amidohydrolase family protein [Hyphomicrobiaceae bacterium]
MSEMDRHGITRALAVAWQAIRFDAHEGNDNLLAACKGSHGRLLPVAVQCLARFDAMRDTFDTLKGRGFAAAAVLPGFTGGSFQDYGFRAFAKDFEAAGMPLILGVDDRAGMSMGVQIAGAKSYPVLLRWTGRGGYTLTSDLIAMARDYPNVMFDVASATQSGAIELLADRIGASRLFIGTGCPENYASCGWFLLRAAELPPESRAAIAGGNLARVLGLTGHFGLPESSQWQRLTEMPKIDTHWHTSGWNMLEPRIDFEDLSRSISAYNMRTIVTSSIRGLNDDIVAGNEETAAFLDREPRARGYVVINPLRPADSLQELAKRREDARFVGAKSIQDFYGLRLDAREYRPILKALGELKDWPIMAHLPGMRKAAMENPEVQFIAAHSTWRHRELADLPNVWFDIATSTSKPSETDIRDLIDVVGIDRVLFSSDAQLMDPAFTLGKVADLNLSDSDLQMLCAGNALRAFPRLKPGSGAEPR